MAVHYYCKTWSKYNSANTSTHSLSKKEYNMQHCGAVFFCVCCWPWLRSWTHFFFLQMHYLAKHLWAFDHNIYMCLLSVCRPLKCFHSKLGKCLLGPCFLPRGIVMLEPVWKYELVLFWNDYDDRWDNVWCSINHNTMWILETYAWHF